MNTGNKKPEDKDEKKREEEGQKIEEIKPDNLGGVSGGQAVPEGMPDQAPRM